MSTPTNSSQDPNLVHPVEQWLARVFPVVFPGCHPVTDWGCGTEQSYMKILEGLGYPVFGYDYHVANSQNTWQVDLRQGPFRFGAQSYTLCLDVLKYFTPAEVAEQLRLINEHTHSAVLLYTPSTQLQCYSDPASVSFWNAAYLARMCSGIIGTAVVLNFWSDPATNYGPMVYWKMFGFSSGELDVLLHDIKLALDDPMFSITIV